MLGAIPSILIFTLIILLLWKYYRTTKLRQVFWPALVLKIAAGGFLGYMYFFYYNFGDTISFFKDSEVLANYATQNPSGYLKYLWTGAAPSELLNELYYLSSSPRAVWFSKLSSLLNLISGSNYWIISAYFSLFAFSAAMYLVRAISENFKNSFLAAAGGILFFPSVVLWPSGLTKESLAVGCIMFLIALTIRWGNNKGKNFKYLFAVLLVLWLLWKIKYYYAGLLAPALLAVIIPVLWSKYLPAFSPPKLIQWLTTLAFFILLATFSKKMLGLDILPSLITDSYHTYMEKSDPGDIIIYSQLNNEWSGILKSLPLALFSGLFRPFVNDYNSWIKLPVILENTVLILLLFSNWKFIVAQIKKLNLWLLSALFYIFSLAAFLAMSAPNFGTLTRYKAGWTFIFTFIVLYRNPLIKKIFKL